MIKLVVDNGGFMRRTKRRKPALVLHEGGKVREELAIAVKNLQMAMHGHVASLDDSREIAETLLKMYAEEAKR